MKIKDLPDMEKPYEKLENYGASKLSDAELLAVIIKSGTKNKTSVDLAQEVLLLDKDKKGLTFLKDVPIEDLQKTKGLGRVKSIQIKAVAELANRIATPQKILRKQINSPEDVASILMSEMKDEPQEMIKTLILNTKNELIRIVTNAIGSVSSSVVEIRDIFKEPIKSNATQIILVHNHPSGDSEPSASDIKFTQKIKNAGEIFGIDVIDHIIIGNGTFSSLKRLRKF